MRTCNRLCHFCVTYKKQRQRGQGLVELVVALPIFLILLIGMIETVALANDYLRLQTTVREGARYGSHAAVPGTAEGAAQIRTLIVSQLATKNMQVLDPERDIVIVFASLKTGGKGRIERVQFPAFSASCPSDLEAEQILARARKGGRAVNSVMVGVKACFNHSLVFGLPLISDLVPDPVALHAFAVMPRTKP